MPGCSYPFTNSNCQRRRACSNEEYRLLPGVNIDVFSFRYGSVLSDFLAIGEIQQVVVWFQNRWSDHVWLRESVSCYDTY